jgi:hypothetical protein
MTVTDSAAALIPGPVQPKDGDRFAAWLADINWAKLFPEGRDLSYAGGHPEEFAEAIREEFGFDPSADPLWGKRIEGGDGQARSASYGFHCPAEKLDAMYAAHGSHRFPGRLRILNR